MRALTASLLIFIAAPMAAQELLPSQAALVALARSAVVAEVHGDPPPRSEVRSPTLPVFVTIEREGRVIGCRGSLVSRRRSVEEEVILAARSAAAHDPRYAPLTRRDLERFQVTITVVRRLEPIQDLGDLSPAEGLVLTAGSRVGVVLPWEGRDPNTRLKWAYRKAGVAEGSAVQLQRLIAERFRG